VCKREREERERERDRERERERERERDGYEPTNNNKKHKKSAYVGKIQLDLSFTSFFLNKIF